MGRAGLGRLKRAQSLKNLLVVLEIRRAVQHVAVQHRPSLVQHKDGADAAFPLVVQHAVGLCHLEVGIAPETAGETPGNRR